MASLLTLRVHARNADEISERIWEQPGVLGIQESPLGGDLFAVPEDFEILEFGSEAAQKCADWLDRESFRRDREILLKVFLEPSPDWEIDAFVKHASGEKGAALENYQVLADDDYLENYRRSVQGTLFGKNLWIGPPWATPPAASESFWVEPGLAFGTGGHPTTQLCFERLQSHSGSARFDRVFDLGTGSGILGVAVRRYWPSAQLTLSDLDPLCEQEVLKTFQLNGLGEALPRGFYGPRGTARALREAGESFDLVVSNIYAEILTAITPDVAALLRPGGRWIVSGILRGPPEERFLEATDGLFRRLWSESRIQHGSRLDPDGGLRALEECWVAYEFERMEKKQ